MTVHVYCETAELMVEAAAIAAGLGLVIAPELTSSPLGSAAERARTAPVAVALSLAAPPLDDALAARTAAGGGGRLVVAWLGREERSQRDFLRDVGMVCVSDVGPALSAAAWLRAGAGADVRPAARRLTEADRVRIGMPAPGTGERGGFRLVSNGAEGVALARDDKAPLVALGHAAWASEAARAIRESEPAAGPPLAFRPPADLSASRDVLFGPPRKLSDPASKAALAPFGLPLPQEELCGSPSRAAAEAGRIGFPVRIALASPDLRVWDHPELCVDGIDNAARVRDLYRQLSSRAAQLSGSARVLGVSVSATTLARALLRMSARPARERRVSVRLGFADPHGMVTRDVTATVLPASRASIERTLRRLRGHPLLLGSEAGERQQTLELLAELLTALACFVDTFREEVERVDLNPVAVLVGGGAEVREAAVHVTDAYVRELG
jgi:hypothetical protein